MTVQSHREGMGNKELSDLTKQAGIEEEIYFFAMPYIFRGDTEEKNMNSMQLYSMHI